MSKVFGEITQLGYVVKDIDKAIEHWAHTLGIGPFLVMRKIQASEFSYRGKASPSPILTIALANSGGLQIELIQQHDDKPSIYKDFIDQGREGLQHFSSWITSAEMAPKKAELSAAGYTLIQEGRIAEGGISFVYYDTQDGAGTSMFEVADIRDEKFIALARTVEQAAANWDGKNAILEPPA